MNSLNYQDITVAEIVISNYKTATIFKKYGIDFCCGGNINLVEICNKKNISFSNLIHDLQSLDKIKNLDSFLNNPSYLELGQLADYIEKYHHTYVRSRLPEIEPFLQKVVKVHGKTYPFLNDVLTYFKAVSDELTDHMWKEENVLFPYIKNMMKYWQDKAAFTRPSFGSIKNPISTMEHEHETAGNAFKTIRNITNDLTPPRDACNTFKVTYSLLNEFEIDLHRHIHLENNILFPKSIELENILISFINEN